MLKIGGVAERTGVSRDTLRFYEDRDLLTPVDRTESGYRLYDESAITRVRFIKQAQALGLTLTEIKVIVEILEGGRPPCYHVRNLLGEKVASLDQQILDLNRLRDGLVARLRWAEAHPATGCDGKDYCVYLEPPETDQG